MVDLINIAKNLKAAGKTDGYFSTGTPGESYYFTKLDSKDPSSEYLFIPADEFKINNHEHATELEFLRWFYKNSGVDRVDKFTVNLLKRRFVNATGMALPQGYEIVEEK